MNNEDLDAIVQDSDAASDITVESNQELPRSTYSVSLRLPNEARGTRRARKPFHFRTNIAANLESAPLPSSSAVAPVDEAQEATYSRYKYYQRLRGPPQGDPALAIPDHVVPSVFFYPYIPGTAPLTGKQSSLITIFAVWNTMMGTSLLSMPWAIEQAGLVAGLALILVMAGLCFYTAYCILIVFETYAEKENLPDLPDLCMFLLGRPGQLVSIIFSAIALIGASAVYWVLMSNFMYHSVKYVHDLIADPPSAVLFKEDNSSSFDLFCPGRTDNHTLVLYGAFSDNSTDSTFEQYWNLNLTVPIYLAVVIFPLLCLKSVTFFTRFNALGTISVFYIISFVVTKASQWGFHADFVNKFSPYYIPLVQSNFPALSGTLALALFLHNCVVTIMKNNKHQEKNGRDLSIAYLLVAITYLGIGATFYLAFPMEKDCIEDNLLNNFSRSDTMTVIARVFLLFQMLTVFPLLVYILRTQLLYAFFHSIYPSSGHVLGLNLTLLITCVSFAIFLPQVGTIIRFSGAFCGMVYIFTLPSLLYIVSVRKQNNGKAPVWVYIIHSLIILCGVLNLVAQFAVSN